MFRRIMIPVLLVVAAGWFSPATPHLAAQNAHDIRLIKKLGEEDARDRRYLKELQDPAKRGEMIKQMLDGYDVELRKATRELASKRISPDEWEVVKNQRVLARQVIDRPDLTKEMIYAELDPIFEKLERTLTPSRADVLANQKGLRQLRRKLSRINAGRAQIEQLEKIWLIRLLAEEADHLKVLVKNSELAEQLDPEEWAGIMETNRRRLILGLAPLAIDTGLIAASRDHSKDMVEKGFFAHNSPVEGKTTPWDRARLAGTTANGENIAAGQSTGTGAVRAWWHSPGHLKNMMNPSFKRIGLGREQNHWTQMFGR